MKRKTAVYILAAVTAFSLAACGQTGGGGTQTAALQESSAAPAEEAAAADGTAGEESASVAEEASAGDTASVAEGAAGTDEEGTAGSNILIAYFTVPETDGVDTVAGASRVVVDGEVLGNNQYIAQLIQGEVGGDLYAIETVQEYPGSHDPLLEYAYTEKAENARPELAGQIENLEDYDVIFLGYPNWNADLPMPCWASRSGGMWLRPSSTPSWRALISAARPSSRSRHTAAAVFRERFRRYRNFSRVPRLLKMACPSPEIMCLRLRAL